MQIAAAHRVKWFTCGSNTRGCRSHRGDATLEFGGEAISGLAEFILPVEGPCIVGLLPVAAGMRGANFGTNLNVYGAYGSRTFHMRCPECYVRPGEGTTATGQWALITPINRPAAVTYAPSAPAKRARVLLNNFDFQYGDIQTGSTGFSREGQPLTVSAGGTQVEFRWREDRRELISLVRAEIHRSGCLTEFTFEPSPYPADEDLASFANDVADICTFAMGSGCGVGVVEREDEAGSVISRIIRTPVESPFTEGRIVRDFHVARLFRECFETYQAMRQAHPPWRALSGYCGSISDCPTLEQKFASLIMALEFFMRNSLLEHGLPETRVSRMDFMDLIGAARHQLGWAVPGHYTARDIIRLLRNAVMHGGELPMADSAEFREYFDKWRLFLFRRVLIRLGYAGSVRSPHRGHASSSAVNDFAEEHNSFRFA